MRQQRVAALRAARLQIKHGETRALASGDLRIGSRHAEACRSPCSATAPLAKARVSPFSRGDIEPWLYISPASANPGCAGVSYGVWRRIGRVAAAGERGEPLSLTLTPAALWRGLAARWDCDFARI